MGGLVWLIRGGRIERFPVRIAHSSFETVINIAADIRSKCVGKRVYSRGKLPFQTCRTTFHFIVPSHNRECGRQRMR
ncbi:hypothetical protein CGZ80_18955 [Rhodopirellula sp. MGV]|nr:hypothetical protein CGZ80_18955 [Rhodopirellula sp. MGV]PNY35364.1 hypothetical protein C2E31_17755 [Rhodopirellula baltica]